MNCLKPLSIPANYYELAHLLFMLEMSAKDSHLSEYESLKIKIDEYIAVIHANNVIEFISLKK